MASIDPSEEEEQVGGIAGSAIGDHPTHTDSLGFKPYVDAIAEFLLADATKPPITISIEGEWGSGKSSFLLQLEDVIVGERRFDAFLKALPEWLGGESSSGSLSAAWKKLRGPRPPLTVRFNAWRHDKQDSLWAAFALAFVESLREKIGFRRAWLGDLKLFLKRLSGLRGWLQLVLLVLSALLLVTGVVAFSIYVTKLAPTDVKALLKHILDPQKNPSGMIESLVSFTAHGTWAVIAAVGFAGIYKFHAYFKMPLSLNLEKYLSKPDYKGHVAFIENFHRDLKRLIEAYAGNKRVFVFVDDLDRCDVPRAAELMQAINLMIGDAGNLVFILGMDREKVAAGIALKYKELFRFLRESAEWEITSANYGLSRLRYGYAYLEKFIQISFSLPVARGQATLDEFLDERLIVAPSGWRARVWEHWKNRLHPTTKTNAFTGFKEASQATTDVPSPVSAAEQAKIEFRRVQIKKDTKRVHEIVRMVGPLFENNPRRIKQFINTFRLAIYIASDLGLFDRVGGARAAATPEQLGKLVALLLRFPDLRYELEKDPNLLASFEQKALDLLRAKVAHDKTGVSWFDARGTFDLFTMNLDGTLNEFERYSLNRLDVSRFFTILPRAPRPPITLSEQSAQPEELTPEDNRIITRLVFIGDAYKYMLDNKQVANEQGRTKDDLFSEAVAAARSLTLAGHRFAVSPVFQPGSMTDPGLRFISIAIAYAQFVVSDIEWLLQLAANPISPEEESWCIRTLKLHEDKLPVRLRGPVHEAVQKHWTMAELAGPEVFARNKILRAAEGLSSSMPVTPPRDLSETADELYGRSPEESRKEPKAGIGEDEDISSERSPRDAEETVRRQVPESSSEAPTHPSEEPPVQS